MDGTSIGELGFRVDAPRCGELHDAGVPAAAVDVAEDEVARRLSEIDALRRDRLVELPDRRSRQREDQGVRIGGRIGVDRTGGADAACLGDQRQIGDVAGNRDLSRDAADDGADRIELDVAARGRLQTGRVGARNRAEVRLSDAAELQVGGAPEIDLRLRQRRDRSQGADHDETLLSDADIVGRHTVDGVGVHRQLPRTCGGQKRCVDAGQRCGVRTGERKRLRGSEAPDRAGGRVKHDFARADVQRQLGDTGGRHVVGRVGAGTHRVGQLVDVPLGARSQLLVQGGCGIERVGEAGVVGRQRRREARVRRRGLELAGLTAGRAEQGVERHAELRRRLQPEQILVLLEAGGGLGLDLRRRNRARGDAGLRRDLRGDQAAAGRSDAVGRAVGEGDIAQLPIIIVRAVDHRLIALHGGLAGAGHKVETRPDAGETGGLRRRKSAGGDAVEDVARRALKEHRPARGN